MSLDKAAEAFAEFVGVVKALRTPGTGCPWDLEQTHLTLRPYLIEEAYEVLDALDAGHDAPLCEEFGDLLLQVVLHAQLAADRGAFTIADVICGITAKMIRRHPHVFGAVKVNNAAEVMQHWERLKAEERGDSGPSAAESLERLPAALPALARAQRLGEKAARTHVDFGSIAQAIQAARGQLDRLEASVNGAASEPARAEFDIELGDLLFTLCQVARKVGIQAEDSLRASDRRFIDRFTHETERKT
jgi:MazG family protein